MAARKNRLLLVSFLGLLATFSACSSPRSVLVTGSADPGAIGDAVRDVFAEHGFRILDWERGTTEMNFGIRETTTEYETVRHRPRVRLSRAGGGWLIDIYIWRQEGEMEGGIEVATDTGERDDDLEYQMRDRIIGALQSRGLNAELGPQ